MAKKVKEKIPGEVIECPRCHGPHDRLVFTKLSASIMVDGASCTSWALCPELDEPIFMEPRPPVNGRVTMT